ncbi:DNA repair protein RecN [Tropicimonas sp. S265A]|uniref:DNA repair protein RecN n=1 Tax=Tropicimonas sp. S265A TaxID=3415134 RepID=UPI003C7CD2C0
MLARLEIRDILIIDHLALDFRAGLNALTGETGAGKSILLDALGFVLGWRGRADLVRRGAAQGEVTAVFDLAPSHPAFEVLRDAGLPFEDGDLVLRRVNTSEGRKSAYVNDRSCSGAVLRALSDVLVELHGQQDDRGLLNPRAHCALLDAYGGYSDLIAAVRDAWSARQAARAALDAALETQKTAAADEGFLRHAVEELDALDPQVGEEADLDRRRRLMQGAEKIRDDVARASAAMAEDGAEGRLTDAIRWLEDVADRAEGALDAPLAALSRALVELGEASDATAAFLNGLAFDPIELEQTEERLFALRSLARKHGVMPDELATHAETLRVRLEAIDGGETRLAALQVELTAAEQAYAGAAQSLTAARTEAARRLDAAMVSELAPLKMDRAVFRTEIVQGDAGPTGADRVTFTVATNPGAPSGPLNKIASGGELSRFLLALKVCLTAENDGLTLIFDEIDRGVGGATADAVGRRLQALAAEGQVLVVTHSPQVAALAAQHWRIEKSVVDETTLSRVVPLDPHDRVDEIARMISGDRVTDAARQAAEALLSAA